MDIGLGILVFLMLLSVAVLGNAIGKNADKVIRAQEKRADDLLAKIRDFESKLNDRIGEVQLEVHEMKKQLEEK